MLPEACISASGDAFIAPDGKTYLSAHDLFEAFEIELWEGETVGWSLPDRRLVAWANRARLDRIAELVAGMVDGNGLPLPDEELEVLRLLVARW